MNILGISAYYHDSAAVLVRNGTVVCAIEEERFSRIKHDNGFPYQAIEFCLHNTGLTIDDIDIVSYYEKPLLKFERIIETFVATYPKAVFPFLKGMPEWLDYKIKIEHTIRHTLRFKGKIQYTPHHVSHAASAFYPSPFKEAAILTIDGVGEYQTTGLWLGKNNSIIPLKKIDFPHSIGLLYSTFTAFLGFKVNEDEYKLMGLSAYGNPSYVSKIKSIIDVKKDGSFALNLDYFSFRERFQMWNGNFETLFGKPRSVKEPITIRHKNIAASIQKITEEVYMKMLNHLYQLTRMKSVCIAGGVGLNALANGKIYTHTPFKKVYIFGAAGDSGAALGSALYSYIHTKKVSPIPARVAIKTHRTPIISLSLGSSYSDTQVEQILKQYKLRYKKLSVNKLLTTAAQLLADGHIIGWFQGKAELGPRALGNHSILCKPNPRNMKTKMNIIKLREQFRPFAGSVLQEKVDEYFEVPEKNHSSPFMVFCFPVKKEKRQELAAIVHKDNTCRIQTVSRKNGLYYRLIKEYYKKTGMACILNTSFNLRGEPIVETPEQAINDFLKTKIDLLYIGSFLICKY